LRKGKASRRIAEAGKRQRFGVLLRKRVAWAAATRETLLKKLRLRYFFGVFSGKKRLKT
jgi:hypothetical protein